VKLNATAFLPANWKLGGTAVYASGLPFSFISQTEDSDDAGYFQSRRLFGHFSRGLGAFVPENRNIHRNPAAYQFNVRTEKVFVIGKSSASAFFEVFNLLNTDNLRVYTVDPGLYTLQIDGTRDFGRRYQFGFTINF